MANLWKGSKDRKRYKPADFIPSVKTKSKGIDVRNIGAIRGMMISMSKMAQPKRQPPKV